MHNGHSTCSSPLWFNTDIFTAPNGHSSSPAQRKRDSRSGRFSRAANRRGRSGGASGVPRPRKRATSVKNQPSTVFCVPRAIQKRTVEGDRPELSEELGDERIASRRPLFMQQQRSHFKSWQFGGSPGSSKRGTSPRLTNDTTSLPVFKRAKITALVVTTNGTNGIFTYKIF